MTKRTHLPRLALSDATVTVIGPFMKGGLLARDEMKSQLFHLRLEGEIHRRRVDAAAQERGQAFLGAAQLQEGDIFRRIETGIFKHDPQD